MGLEEAKRAFTVSKPRPVFPPVIRTMLVSAILRFFVASDAGDGDVVNFFNVLISRRCAIDAGECLVDNGNGS